jgi:hypothetical protein
MPPLARLFFYEHASTCVTTLTIRVTGRWPVRVRVLVLLRYMKQLSRESQYEMAP